MKLLFVFKFIIAYGIVSIKSEQSDIKGTISQPRGMKV